MLWFLYTFGGWFLFMFLYVFFKVKEKRDMDEAFRRSFPHALEAWRNICNKHKEH